jgi:hypothetical protein
VDADPRPLGVLRRRGLEVRGRVDLYPLLVSEVVAHARLPLLYSLKATRD